MAVRFLDTSVCVDFLRGRLGPGYQTLRNNRCSMFKLPAIVVAELYASAQPCNNPTRSMRLVEDFVNAFEIAPFDADCAQEYCRIRAELEQYGRHGRVIGERSMMIAATACANRAVLSTSDERGYGRIPGLRLEIWESER